MIHFFPESALVQLEFDKVRDLLQAHCQSLFAKEKVQHLRVHTRPEFVELELKQTYEYVLLLRSGHFFPAEVVHGLETELKLLAIPGSVLSNEAFLLIRGLAASIHQVYRWFTPDAQGAYPGLANVIKGVSYEKKIAEAVDEVFEANGSIRDNASAELARIRSGLYRKRAELRRVFDRVLQRWAKSGYIADTEEAFLNGRRVVAILSEHKRQVRGLLMGESDTRKTAFIEPEETIELNNDVFELETEESKEVYRILKELTNTIRLYEPLLSQYLHILGIFDFIRAKAKLAIDMDANLPQLQNTSTLSLLEAYHPLLLLYNRKSGKPTIPTNITLDDRNRILVISGPNAGGKTVTLKTVGLLQLMVQSGLLVPVHPDSCMGIFKQFMIHIGDTQSIEFDLSTYSSHLRNMKYFVENANGRTLFFIDELGSGSDPHLGGAFAEVILEELVKKHALGIVTTHYLNLKLMAGKTPGIINGAMAFDEKELLPLFRLQIGKPGSSYTFSIAERIGLAPRLIERARHLVEEDHFKLDKLLNRTEQQMQQIEKREKELHQLLKENTKLRKEMEETVKGEKHRQQVELLRQQNKMSAERLQYLKDMERKLRQLIADWKKAEQQEDKRSVIRQMQQLLFQRPSNQAPAVQKKKEESVRYSNEELAIGKKVMMLKSHKVGEVTAFRGKKVVVKVGLLPMIVDPGDLRVVIVPDTKEKPPKEGGVS
jgi:DNA mismatch repair protein MutS2